MKTPQSKSVWNLPNQITVVRIVISLFVFIAVQVGSYGWAFGLFVLAAGTDWLDGYIARSRNLVTQLGRILDPLADKILICGTFVFLAATPGSQVPAWIAVVVIARELIVTVLRSYLEQQGRDFSANMPGKLKMVFQCVCAATSLYLLASQAQHDDWLPTVVTVLAWLAMLSTVYSGMIYILAASRPAADHAST